MLSLPSHDQSLPLHSGLNEFQARYRPFAEVPVNRNSQTVQLIEPYLFDGSRLSVAQYNSLSRLRSAAILARQNTAADSHLILKPQLTSVL
jgi:hypothetical protein